MQYKTESLELYNYTHIRKCCHILNIIQAIADRQVQTERFFSSQHAVKRPNFLDGDLSTSIIGVLCIYYFVLLSSALTVYEEPCEEVIRAILGVR